MDNYYNPMSYPQTAYYQPVTSAYQSRWQSPQYVAQPSYAQNSSAQFQQLQPQSQLQSQFQQGYMCWVQGLEGAKAYVLPNGVTMPLWDSENQTVYIKSVDQAGRPTMTILDYVERNPKDETKETNSAEYATKEQVNDLMTQFSSINEKLNSLGGYVTRDQFDSLSTHLNDLSGQIEDIENRLTGFSKPQPQSNNQNRRNK